MIIAEFLMLLDLLLNFFIVSPEMNKPTLKMTALHYLKGWFILDFIPTIVANIMVFSSNKAVWRWSFRLKLLRIFRTIMYLRYAYKGITAWATTGRPKARKLIDLSISTVIETVFWVHILTCIWIKLGSRDKTLDDLGSLSYEEQTWMFLVGTDFSAD